MHPSCCPTAVSITCAKWKGDKAHFPCLPEQLMEFADLVYGQVDFAPLCCSWPQDKLEQIGVLKDICAEAWHHSCGPGVESYLARKAQRRIARIMCETRFGQRWFDIWQKSDGNQIIVVKEPAPDSPLVVCCDLTASRAGIHVAFKLLSGRALGTVDFNTALAEEPLLIQDLRQAACEQALHQGLLETRHQLVGLALPGFKLDPCDSLMLWPNQAVTEEELQDWLGYLQSRPAEELISFCCVSGEDTSGSGMSEEPDDDLTERL